MGDPNDLTKAPELWVKNWTWVGLFSRNKDFMIYVLHQLDNSYHVPV